MKRDDVILAFNTLALGRKLRPGEAAPLKVYDVFKQVRPIELRPPNRVTKDEGEYKAAFVCMGQVKAISSSSALDKAREQFGLLLPAVQEARD